MAPKPRPSNANTSTSMPSRLATPGTATTSKSIPSSSSSSSSTSLAPQEVAIRLWNNYWDKTPQRTKLLDVFLVFLMAVGVVQFVYCVVAGNYPFNAFLAGFSSTVGQFVLTAALRMQTNPENEKEFKAVSPERAFADYVLGSLILHFFCINFIN